jgi:type IV secretory pathway TrbL component
LVNGAWSRFKAGDTAGYLSSVAAAADAAYESGAHVVTLAQASMAGASALIARGEKPLTSPATGLAAAVQAVALLM